MNPHDQTRPGDRSSRSSPSGTSSGNRAGTSTWAAATSSASSGGGLLVLCLGRDDEAQEPGRASAGAAAASGGGGGGQLPREIDAWLHIGEDGTVTASTGKVEVGQNARTSLTMAVADELNLPVESVQLVMGDTDHVPFDMGTFGSRTTPTMVPQMRRAAAAARGLLLDLAAKEWGVDAARSRPPAAR